MATTVGQHSVAAFTSPVNGTTPIDANSVRGNDNTVRSAYVDHDADPGIHVQSSTLASRPAAGTAGRKWITEDSGVYTLWFDDGTNWHPVSSENINLTVLATETLVKGDVVKVTGWNNGQDLPEVAKVSSTSDTAFAIITANVANGAMGYATNTGIIQDLATNGFSVGAILYPNGSGWFTATKPTSGTYQAAAYVLRSNANNGVLFVEFSAPRIVESSSNTASTVVLRDASGNFAAGTITAGALTSTGLVTFASLKGTGATTVTNILDEDNMASDSATALATQQSIKAYVDAQVATVDTLAEVLANGNTTGANNIIVSSGQKITTNTIDETTAAAGVTIDSVLLKDDVVNATDIEVDTISANNGTLAVTLGSTGVATIAQQPILSSLTASQAVFTDASKGLVSNAITGTGNVVMSASPTLTGTVTAATINATTLGGTLSTAAQPNVTSLGTLSSLAVTGNLTLGADVVLSRGAADRLDLASGDSLNVVSGTYKIAGTDVLSSNTLGSGVTASSLTSVGTLTSLTVSGTSSLSTINSSATYTQTVGSGSGSVSVVNTSTGGGSFFSASCGNGTTSVRFNYNIFKTLETSPHEWRIGQYGDKNFTFYDFTNTAARMTLDTSGNLAVDTNTLYVDAANNRVGVGTASPSDVLEVRFGSNGYITASNSTDTNTGIKVGNTGRIYGIFADGGSGASNSLRFFDFTASAERMRLDTSGNLGLGVTPSAWGTASSSRAQQIGTSLSFLSFGAAGQGAHVGGNTWWDGTNWKYVNSTGAVRYELDNAGSSHKWYVAASGTAGNNITFTQAMTLDASGNLGVGGTAASGVRLHVESSDTQVTIKDNNTNKNASPSTYINFEAANARAGYIGYPGANDLYINNESSGAIFFYTSAVERARITSGGSFLMAANSVIGLNTSDGSDNGYLALVGAGADGENRGGGIYLHGNERSSDAGDIVLQAGNVAGGGITFRTGASVDRGYFAASGEFLVNTASANGQLTAKSTTNDGTSFALGTQSNAGTDLFRVRGDGALYMGLAGNSPYNLTTGSAANAFLDSGGYLYRSTSSLKYKTDIEDATHGLTEVLALRPVTYKGINDGDKVFGGLIAEEVHEAGLSEFVVYDAEGQPDALHYGNMVSLLVKAVQEQQAMIMALEARLEALEA